jgi:hypothetical protein
LSSSCKRDGQHSRAPCSRHEEGTPYDTGAQRTHPQTLLSLNTQTPRYKWLVAGIVLLACATQIFSGTSLNIDSAGELPEAPFGSHLGTQQGTWAVA